MSEFMAMSLLLSFSPQLNNKMASFYFVWIKAFHSIIVHKNFERVFKKVI